MPLPLLAIPFAVAAANASISASAAVGIGVGSAAVGGAGATGLWFWLKSIFKPSQAHQASLNAQNRATAERVENAQGAINALSSTVAGAAETHHAAVAATTASVSQLHEASKRILTTSANVSDSALVIQAGIGKLTAETSVLSQISTVTHENSMKTTKAFTELNARLDETKHELVQANSNIKILSTTVSEQSTVITNLGKVVIEQKQTIDTLTDEKKILTEEAKRAVNHCKFFKQSLQKAHQVLSERELARPDSLKHS